SSLSSPNAPAQSILSLSSDTATTEIYTLSLHDALPISRGISVTDVNKLAEQDSTLDRELDARQRELASAGDCVVESRLAGWMVRSEEHTSELQSRENLVCRLLLEKKKKLTMRLR